MNKFIILYVSLCVLVSCSGTKLTPLPTLSEIDRNKTNSLIPDIGMWLQYDNGENANWLGKKYNNRILLEPINIVIIDRNSKTSEEAIQKLISECKRNGYDEEYGHSSGYIGQINNTEYTQIPNEKHMAFANKDFYKTNNHGRIIGPAFYNGTYIFIAAFSTERPTIKTGLEHSYISFTKARDDFARHMNNGIRYPTFK